MAATSTGRARRASSLGSRQRLLQLALLLAGLAAVVVGDRVAGDLRAAGMAVPAALLVPGVRVTAGWAAGMALRMQLAPTGRGDEQLRTLLGIPLGFLTAWPILLLLLPPGGRRLLPGPLLTDAAALQPVAAVLFGVVLALAVSPRRR
jgi:hypothetical protein